MKAKTSKKDNQYNRVMIERYSFGKIVVDGVTYTNDIKIVQGRVVSEWWRKKGHSVGIEDIQNILESNPRVLMIGKGQPGMMRSSRSLRRFLKENDIELIEEKTSQAITGIPVRVAFQVIELYQNISRIQIIQTGIKKTILTIKPSFVI